MPGQQKAVTSGTQLKSSKLSTTLTSNTLQEWKKIEKENSGSSYRAKGPQENGHGLQFEFQLFMLSALYELKISKNNNNSVFYLASGMKQFGVLDDTVIFYKKSSRFYCIAMQCKHSQSPAMVAEKDFKSSDGDFSLRKYYKSYVEIYKEWIENDLFGPVKVREHKCVVKKMFLCTNDHLDPKMIGQKYLLHVDPVSLLNIAWNDAKGIRYSTKFYKINTSYMKDATWMTTEEKKSFDAYLDDFCNQFILVFNFPDSDIIAKFIDEEYSDVIGNNSLSGKVSWQEHFHGWLFNRFASVLNSNECRFLDQEELNQYFKRLSPLFLSRKRLFFDTLSYTFMYDVVFQRIRPEIDMPQYEKLKEYAKNSTKSTLRCYTPFNQPMKWTIAQVYWCLKSYWHHLNCTNENIIVLSWQMVEEKLSDFIDVMEAETIWAIIKCEVCQNNLTRVDQAATKIPESFCSKSKAIFIMPSNKLIEQDCFECPPLRYQEINSWKKTQLLFQDISIDGNLEEFVENIKDVQRDELLKVNGVLEKLISGEILQVGENWEKFNTVYCGSEVHMNRNLRVKNIVDWKKLLKHHTENDDSERFLITTSPATNKQRLLKEVSGIMKSERFKFVDICDERKLQEIVHDLQSSGWKECCIHVLNVHQLDENVVSAIWYRSYSASHVSNFFFSENNATSTQNISDQEFHLRDRVSIIEAEPGMGKSYFMGWLFSQNLSLLCEKQKFVWKIYVELGDYNKLLSESKFEDVFAFLSQTFSRDVKLALTEHWLRCFSKDLSRDHVLMVGFDGFDELNNEAQETIIKLTRQLEESEATVRLILTTRPHTISKLQKAFGYPTYDFIPVTKEQQLNYLQAYWKMSPPNHAYAGGLRTHLDKCITEQTESLLGTPLLCQILAIAFDPNTGSHDIPTEFDVAKLYQRFIRRKFEIFYFDKLGRQRNDKFELADFDRFIQVHQGASLFLLEPELYEEWYKRRGDERSIINDGGIARIVEEKGTLSFVNDEIINRSDSVKSVNMQTCPHFFHRTFAEHFVATVFMEILTAQHETDFIFQKYYHYLMTSVCRPGGALVRMFLDFLTKEIPVSKERWNSIQKSWLVTPHSDALNKVLKREKMMFCYGMQSQKKSRVRHNMTTTELNKNAFPISDQSLRSTDTSVLQKKNIDYDSSEDFIMNLYQQHSRPEWYVREQCEIELQCINEFLQRKDVDKCLKCVALNIAADLISRFIFLPCQDRKYLVSFVRQNILCHNVSCSAHKIFNIKSWLTVCDFVVDIKDASCNTTELIRKHQWLFDCVFPTLLETIYFSPTSSFGIIAIKEPVVRCLADLLHHDTKSGDTSLFELLQQLDQCDKQLIQHEEEINKLYGDTTIKLYDWIKDNQNVFRIIRLIDFDQYSKELSDRTEIKNFFPLILRRYPLVQQLNSMLWERAEDQHQFFEHIFAHSLQSEDKHCDMDSLLQCSTGKIIAAIEHWCQCTVRPSTPLTQLYTRDNDFEFYTFHLIANLKIMTMTISECIRDWIKTHNPYEHGQVERAAVCYHLVTRNIPSYLFEVIESCNTDKVDAVAFVTLLGDIVRKYDMKNQNLFYYMDSKILNRIVSMIQKTFDTISTNKMECKANDGTFTTDNYSICLLLIKLVEARCLFLISDRCCLKLLLEPWKNDKNDKYTESQLVIVFKDREIYQDVLTKIKNIYTGIEKHIM